jgi:hypothetical protein
MSAYRDIYTRRQKAETFPRGEPSDLVRELDRFVGHELYELTSVPLECTSACLSRKICHSSKHCYCGTGDLEVRQGSCLQVRKRL